MDGTPAQVKLQHFRSLRDACRSGQDVQARILNEHGDELWLSLTSGYACDSETLEGGQAVIVRKLLLAGLQLLNNLAAGNPFTSKAIWMAYHPDRFLDLLEWSRADRGLQACICAAIHTCIACMPDSKTGIRQLLGATVLYCKLLRITIPPADQTKFEGEGALKTEDGPFEWIFFLICKILEAEEGCKAMRSAGVHRQGEDSSQETSIVTPEQLILLNLVGHVVDDERHREGADQPLCKDGGALCLDLAGRLVCWMEGPLRSEASSGGDVSAVAWAESAAIAVVRIIGGLLSREGHEELRARLVDAGAIKAFVQLLHRAGGQADGVIPTETQAPHPVYEGYKADLVRAMGNLCHRCRKAQDQVRELGALSLLLNHCNVDSSNPFLREWALFTIRNLCEGNEDNQRFIEKLKPQETIATATLRELGLETYLKEGEGGRAKVGVKKV